VAEDLGISLSVHGSYFIVFTSDDPQKLKNSQDTLKRTYELCNLLGSTVVVLHPGPLYSADAEEVLDRFLNNLSHSLDEIGKTDIGLFVETAGKLGQLGSLEEILRICKALPLRVFPCIDFGHIHARTLGSLESETEIDALFQKLSTHYWKDDSQRIHFHYTPIHYGPRGEISHKAIGDTYQPVAQMSLINDLPPDPLRSRDDLFHPRFEPVAKRLRQYGFSGTVISETNDSQEEGALALKRAFFDVSE